MIKTNQKGFTLIELLVVIAVIGILASVIMVSLNSARSKARDALRASNAKEIQVALEVYYNDNGFYPSSPDATFPSTLTALVPNYLPQIPSDPNSATPWHYYNNNVNPADWYAFLVYFENKPACYYCGGSSCRDGIGFWGVNMCK